MTGSAGNEPNDDLLQDERDLERSDSSEKPTMSVVIVAKNEADRIGDCIESVFDVCEPVADFEVILVDSNSEDETVDVASEYPVTVLRIPRDDITGCGAGRHVGFQEVDSEFVLFVDGDMVLEDGWLDTAVTLLRRQDDVAGIDGWLTDRKGGAGEVNYVRGVALYRSAVIDEVGGFDPRIRGLGDVDMGFRLQRAGYRVIRLPVVIASHPPAEGVTEAFRRWREGYYESNGQVLRKSLDDPRLVAKWLYRFRFHITVLGWLLLGAAVGASRSRRLGAAWTAGSAVGVGSLFALRGARWTTVKLSVRFTLFISGLVLGFIKGPQPPEYPLEEIEVIQRPQHDSERSLQHD